MLDSLKALVRGTIVERPARRLHAALTGRAATREQLADQPRSDSAAATPAPCSATVTGEPDLNATYDGQTVAVMARILARDSVCIDVGCHVGQILDEMLRYAPDGHHYAFEPLPDLFEGLRTRYADVSNVTVHNTALSDTEGTFRFHHVTSNPGYSGFRKRRYDRSGEEIVETEVTVEALDNVLSDHSKVALIKIDVEGAELQVMQGAKEILRRSQPVVIFEHGLGAADVYGTRPEHIYKLLSQVGLHIFLMGDWLAGRSPLSQDEFAHEFDSGRNYYFMAAPMLSRKKI